METNDFKISPIIVWGLAIINFCATICGAFLKINHFTNHFNELLIIGLVAGLFLDVVIISDIYKSKLDNKFFWILSVLIFSNIAPIVYMARRKELLGL